MKNCLLFWLLVAGWGLTGYGQDRDSVIYSRDSVMRRLDAAHVILNRINIFMGDEFNTRRIEQDLPAISRILQTINGNLLYLDAVPEFKTLQLYGVMLDDIGGQLSGWRGSLFKYDNELSDINTELAFFSHDSSLRQLAKDSLYLQFYLEELHALRGKWELANQSTGANLTRIKTIQLRVSKQYFLTVDIRSRIDYMKRRLTDHLFQRENRARPEGVNAGGGVDERRMSAFRWVQSDGPLIFYFLHRNRSNYILILLIGGLVWWWLRVTSAARVSSSAGGVRPILYALIALLNMQPLFELHASTFPISELPLLAVLCIFFFLQWSRRQFLCWLIVVVLYVFLLVIRIMQLPESAAISLVVLNVFSITAGYYSLRQLAGNFLFRRMVNTSIWVFEVLNIAALIAGLSGRLVLARIFTTAGIFGVIDVVGLSVFAGCMLEGVKASRVRINEQIKKSISFLLRMYALAVWLLSLSINLNVYDYLAGVWRQLLYRSFQVGTLSFQFVNILLFVLILYFSNFLQKYTGLLFGASDEHWIPENMRNGSRLAMVRLLIIITGFFLAIAASGVPLDKITIIFGALSVGVGLGLQGIVNNLISGIILIFEKPFQIGDYIELKDKRGLVRDIGIRSSKILTEDGSELIMPNADLLSGQVANLTVRGHRVRIAIPITIESGPSREEIESLVRAALANHPGLSQENKPYVLINATTEKQTSLTILVWVSNITSLQEIRSEVLSLLYDEFKRKGDPDALIYKFVQEKDTF